MQSNEILEQARDMIRAEAEAVAGVADQLDESFVEMVHLVSKCTGRILITGAGTSGTIARRTAHLLASCGMPAFVSSRQISHHSSSVIGLMSPGGVPISRTSSLFGLSIFCALSSPCSFLIFSLKVTVGFKVDAFMLHVIKSMYIKHAC